MTEITATLRAGEGLRVFGPVRLAVKSGAITILGAEIGAGRELNIASSRSYYFEAIETSSIAIELGIGGRVEKGKMGEEHLTEWISIVDEALDECPDKCSIVVLGPTDSGKTSLSALVANRTILRGMRPVIIDSDVGQADIGPPGFLALSVPEDFILWLRELRPEKLYFAGHVEPGFVEGRILSGISKLHNYAQQKGDVIILDTDGWIEGWHALENKINILKTIDADTVLVMGSREVFSFFKARWPGKVQFLKSPVVYAERDTRTRRALRQENYKRFLEEGGVREFDLKVTPISNACLLSSEEGEEVKVEGMKALIYKYPGGVCALFDSEEPPPSHSMKTIASRFGVKEVILLYTGGFKGVLISLVDPDGWDHPGVIEQINIVERRVSVRTTYLGPVKLILSGRIRLTEEFEDMSVRRIWI